MLFFHSLYNSHIDWFLLQSNFAACWANLSPSALAAGQENVRDAWMPSGGCQHCGEQRLLVADSKETSAQGCRELGDSLHTGEELVLLLEAPHIPA